MTAISKRVKALEANAPGDREAMHGRLHLLSDNDLDRLEQIISALNSGCSLNDMPDDDLRVVASVTFAPGESPGPFWPADRNSRVIPC